MKYLVIYKVIRLFVIDMSGGSHCSLMSLNFNFFLAAVKYEARLDNGTIISISDGVEFTVEDGQCLKGFNFGILIILF